jgi:hypothetical protein
MRANRVADGEVGFDAGANDGASLSCGGYGRQRSVYTDIAAMLLVPRMTVHCLETERNAAG